MSPLSRDSARLLTAATLHWCTILDEQMAIFEKEILKVISDKDIVDLSKASINQNLSTVDFDQDAKFFYITIDRILFSNPVSTIKTVLDAHGFVPNLENILSCLDSLNFSIYGKSPGKGNKNSPAKVSEYFPCIRFELPKKNNIGDTLRSFYDEISKYESKLSDKNLPAWAPNPELKKNKDLREEIKQLKAANEELSDQVSVLTQQLNREQKSLSRASRALDSQRVLPENAKMCRVEKVDLKRRKIKVKCQKEVIDIPTHMLDRIPNFQERCLIILEEGLDLPLGIIFFTSEEIDRLEKRTAELLYVEKDRFKARDSMRNEFQIKAVNPMEAETIKSLSRGMKVVISIVDGYVVHFSVYGSKNSAQFTSRIQEQLIVYDIAKNQLVNLAEDKKQ